MNSLPAGIILLSAEGEIFGFPGRKNSHNPGFQPSGTESAFRFDQQKERRNALCFSILCLTNGAGRTGFIIGDLPHPDLIAQY
ncbi:MAG: hypothetical protein IIZ14_07390 [Solobacterium sp.]|nr:hypothetical protein [Solobacterium sp.]